MRLIEMECVNYRTLRKFVLAFAPGLTGLLGPNGAGKSSILSALCFGLTGTVTGDDTKGDLLRWGESKGYVRVLFEYEKKRYTIKRNIQGSKVDLREEDAATGLYTSKEDIDSFMSSLIGLHPRLYEKVIFINQGELDSIPMLTHAKRMDFFNDLFDATLADKLRDLVQTYIQKIPTFPEYAEEKERVYLALTTARDALKQVNGELTPLLGSLKDIPSLAEITTKKSLPSQSSVAATVDKLTETLLDLRGVLQLFKQTTMPAFISPETTGYYHQYLRMKELEKQVASADIMVKATPAPGIFRSDVDDVHQHKEDLQVEIKELTNKMRLCELGKCPECSQPYKGSSRETLIKKQEKLKNQLIKVDLHIKAETTRKEVERDLKAADDTLRDYLDQMPNEVLAFDIEAHVKTQRQMDEQSMTIDEYRQLEANSVAAEASLLKLNKELATIQRTETLSDEQRAQYDELLNTVQVVQSRITELTGQQKQQETYVKSYEQRIKDILTEEKKHTRYKEYAALLQRARDVLHRDCLPHVRVAAGLSILNARMAEWLDLFNVPFSLIIDKNCDFIVSFEGTEKHFKVLSGGQRKVASVAFRLAVAEVFGHQLGILSLDEPTAYMDTDAKNNLVDILRRAESRAISKDMYIFISTHESCLINAFTQTAAIRYGNHDTTEPGLT